MSNTYVFLKCIVSVFQPGCPATVKVIDCLYTGDQSIKVLEQFRPIQYAKFNACYLDSCFAKFFTVSFEEFQFECFAFIKSCNRHLAVRHRVFVIYRCALKRIPGILKIGCFYILEERPVFLYDFTRLVLHPFSIRTLQVLRISKSNSDLAGGRCYGCCILNPAVCSTQIPQNCIGCVTSKVCFVDPIFHTSNASIVTGCRDRSLIILGIPPAFFILCAVSVFFRQRHCFRVLLNASHHIAKLHNRINGGCNQADYSNYRQRRGRCNCGNRCGHNASDSNNDAGDSFHTVPHILSVTILEIIVSADTRV